MNTATTVQTCSCCGKPLESTSARRWTLVYCMNRLCAMRGRALTPQHHRQRALKAQV